MFAKSHNSFIMLSHNSFIIHGIMHKIVFSYFDYMFLLFNL